MRSVSAEMPLRVLADLFGMPREDRHLIFQWSNAMLDADSAEAVEQVESGVDAIGAAMAYGQQIAEARRAEPRDDIVSLIANAEIDGDRLDDLEFAMFWVMLVVAGNETTRNALSGSVVALVEQDLWGWLGEHRDALPGAVDELLRFVSPVQHFRRTATEDTVLGDQHVRAGDKVVVWYGAANRDPAVFPDPHRLDLQRDPNPHLAFGVGPALLPRLAPGQARAGRDALGPARPGAEPRARRHADAGGVELHQRHQLAARPPRLTALRRKCRCAYPESTTFSRGTRADRVHRLRGRATGSRPSR